MTGWLPAELTLTGRENLFKISCVDGGCGQCKVKSGK